MSKRIIIINDEKHPEQDMTHEERLKAYAKLVKQCSVTKYLLARGKVTQPKEPLYIDDALYKLMTQEETE